MSLSKIVINSAKEYGLFSELPYSRTLTSISKKSTEAIKILKLCRMLRIFRVAKIGRHNENLRIMMRTMAASSGEMAFMGTLIMMSIVIFRLVS